MGKVNILAQLAQAQEDVAYLLHMIGRIEEDTVEADIQAICKAARMGVTAVHEGDARKEWDMAFNLLDGSRQMIAQQIEGHVEYAQLGQPTILGIHAHPDASDDGEWDVSVTFPGSEALFGFMARVWIDWSYLDTS